MLNAILGIINKGMAHFSPEERRRKRRNQVQRLREKRMEVIYNEKISSDKRTAILNKLDRQLLKLKNNAFSE